MNNRHINWILTIVVIVLAALCLHSITATAADRFVRFDGGDWQLNRSSRISICIDSADQKGVGRAARSLMVDLQKVCGAEVVVTEAAEADILIGTFGHAKSIGQLVKQKAFDERLLRGKRECYVVTSVGQQLVIAGSDRRGTIYGIYELSRQLGVSPWYWWADVPVAHHDRIYIQRGVYSDGEPAVRYRGLFLNDEAPCLTSWVKNTYGTNYGDHRFYERVFELILRLRGNMLWPAMWGWAFYADDPMNSPLADEMGIVMSTSHHEPMARNHQEYARHRAEWGAWNYQTNQQQLDRFFREGIERVKNTEDIITVGMRGDGDEAMSEEADTRLLQRIVENQRRIIKDVTGKPADQTPQVWALYKEVQDYYDKGMRVPDDITLLLCDDNWGNVRRVPNPKERQRKGGWGLYYHVDYVGAPRNTKWINVTQTESMAEQLHLAYDYGIDRIWILNVGDLKPMEYPITLFMDMAWRPQDYPTTTIVSHTRDFFAEQLGETYADEAARIYDRNCQYMARVTPEMLDANTYNAQTSEWRQVADDYARLEAEALRLLLQLPPERHDCYRQLLLFPVQAMANLYEMYYAQAMNHLYYEQGNPDANQWADRTERCFRRDSLLCAQYNKEIAGGKWDGMMTQKHIGYTSWNDDFERDILPEVKRIANPKTSGCTFLPSDGYIAMEAEHYYEALAPSGTEWTVYPQMGRTRSAVALTPYTEPTGNAQLSYRFELPENVKEPVTVHVVVKSTLDFLDVKGMKYEVQLDGGPSQTVNFNSDLQDKQPYMYSVYYPTVARRVVEKTVTLTPGTSSRLHTLTLRPLHPGIVFEKIVIDWGGYQPSYLWMNESTAVWH